MTKHKGFHGPGGKGGLVRQMAFYCRKNPWDVKAQPLKKTGGQYRTCPHCGAHLDPGERCDCRDAASNSQTSGDLQKKAAADAANIDGGEKKTQHDG